MNFFNFSSFLKFLILAIIFIIFFYILYLSKNKKSIKKLKTKNFHPFSYTLFYTDQKSIKKTKNIIHSKILHSKKYNLKGKPDYIFKRGNTFLPIEIKSGKIKENLTPYKGDFFQLIAYFLIIEDMYGKVKYGKLVYSDYTFIIKNKKTFKNELFKIINEMENFEESNFCNINTEFNKCKNCICRLTVCKFHNN